jgi:hypothetical protein
VSVLTEPGQAFTESLTQETADWFLYEFTESLAHTVVPSGFSPAHTWLSAYGQHFRVNRRVLVLDSTSIVRLRDHPSSIWV